MIELKANDFIQYRRPYTLRKDWVFPYSSIEKGAKIILYGAGDVGQAYAAQLKATSYCNVQLWVDANYKMYKEWGLNVVSVADIDEVQYDYVVIAVSESEIANEIGDYLLARGVKKEKIVWPNDNRAVIKTSKRNYWIIDPILQEVNTVLQYENIKKNSAAGYNFAGRIMSIAEEEDKIVIPRLVVELTTACTLKCKKCNNLMPYYSKIHTFSAEEIINNINIALDNIDKVVVLELIGGEPFCFKEISKVVSELLEKDKIEKIEITTNGTIIPDETILKILNNKKIVVRISKYKESNKFENLIKILENKAINYVVLDELVWTDSGEPVSKGKSLEQLKNDYYKCSSARFCKTLLGNKIFCCVRAASLYDLDICRSQFFVELDKDNVREEINKLFMLDYSMACDYCTQTDEWRTIIAGEQLY